MSVYFRSLVVIFALLASGCVRQDTNSASGTHSPGHGGDHHDHEMGPNGGHLIELGDEEYHAEWLHDDETASLTVVILDGAAEKEVAIDATSVTINVVIDDQPKQYVLPHAGESDGGGSRFEIVNEELVTALKVGTGVKAKLQVQIDGVPFSGPIEHAHHH